jgi:hypothetical protein
MIGSRIGGLAGGSLPDPPPKVVCQQHQFLMGGDMAVRRCPACWTIFRTNCMACVHLDELRSRMTGSVCDDCEIGEIHADYGPDSERYSTRNVRYNPAKDGIVAVRRNMKREIRITYGVPFPR